MKLYWFYISVAKIDEQVLQQKDQYQLNSSQQSYYPASASSATKELDDLMASLSDFKVSAIYTLWDID